jgi:hypothetical protein
MSSFTVGQKPGVPSSNFNSILEAALSDYKEKNGSGVLEHPLAEDVKRCDSIGAISAILQGQAREFQSFPSAGAVFTEIGALLSVCIFAITIRRSLLTWSCIGGKRWESEPRCSHRTAIWAHRELFQAPWSLSSGFIGHRIGGSDCEHRDRGTLHSPHCDKGGQKKPSK